MNIINQNQDKENNEFCEFPKLARLSRECIITEKIDGTNAQVLITEDLQMLVGSRTRWITPEQDNYGFAAWAYAHREELMKLGVGRHFGEWWGGGCQRGYGLPKGEKRWSLFNVSRWCMAGETPQRIPTADPRIVKMQDVLPACCNLVPVLYRGIFTTDACEAALSELRANGSKAAPGFMKPEGIVCFHTASNSGFKKTLEKRRSAEVAFMKTRIKELERDTKFYRDLLEQIAAHPRRTRAQRLASSGLRFIDAAKEEATKPKPLTRSISDSDGNPVTHGDRIRFNYGIPPVRVTAKVVQRGERLIVLTPGHDPKEADLRTLEYHV